MKEAEPIDLTPFMCLALTLHLYDLAKFQVFKDRPIFKFLNFWEDDQLSKEDKSWGRRQYCFVFFIRVIGLFSLAIYLNKFRWC